MIDLPIRSEKPLTRETLLTVNERRVQKPLGSKDIEQLNRRKPVEGPKTRREPAGMQDGNRQHTAPRKTGPILSPQPAPGLCDMRIPQLHNPVRKGQKISLEMAGKASKLRICTGWNIQDASCEADVSAFLLQDGKVPGDDWFVFYGQTYSPDGSTAFYDEAEPDREMIAVDLERLDPRVDRIAFILTIHDALEKRLNFSMLKDTYIRILDAVGNRELVSFLIDEYYPNVTSMVIGEIYRHKGIWKFSAVGNGVQRDLAGLCEMYGVQVE